MQVQPAHGFAVLMLALAAGVRADPPVAAQMLVPGQSISASVAAGETRDYRIELPDAASAELRVQLDGQRAIELRWTGPGALPPQRLTAGRGARRDALLIADAPAAWQLRIAARTAGQGAAYTLALAPTGSAGRAQQRRALAMRALAEADDLRLASGSAETGGNAGAGAAGEAEAAYRRAIAAAGSAGDGCLARQAWSGLARLAFAHVDYAKTQAAAQAALRERCVGYDAAADAADRAEAERTLGAARAYQGDYLGAIAAQEQALALYRRTGDRRFEGVVLGNLSSSYAETGQMGRAIGAAQAALQAAEATQDAPGIVFCREMVARLHLARGEFGDALAAYQRTLEELRGTPYPLVENSVWNGLGTLDRQLGDNDQAAEAYAKAQAVAEGTDDRVAVADALLNQAEVQLDAGQPDAARTLAQQALDLAQERGLLREQAGALAVRGRAALALGEFANAGELLAQAEAIARQRDAQATLLDVQLAQGDLALRAGEPRRAALRYRAALALARQARLANREPVALASLARAERALDAPGDALRDLRAALRLIETQRGGIDAPALRSSYFASRRAYYALCIDLLMDLDRREPGHGYAVAAFETAERARARSLLDQLAERGVGVVSPVEPQLAAGAAAAEDALHALAWQLARLSAGANAAQRAALQKQIDEASRRLDLLRGRIRAANPRAAELANPAPLRYADIRQRWLAPRSAVLEYWLGEERSVLWLITRDGVRASTLPAAATLEQWSAQLREAAGARPQVAMEQLAVAEAAQREQLRALGAQLGSALLGPVAAQLRKVDALAVVADGDLQRLPFNLLDAGGAVPAVDAYLPSLQTLRWLRDARAGRRGSGIAVFADPVFASDDPRLSAAVARGAAQASAVRDATALPRLRHSREEAALLAQLAGPRGANLALDFDASRARALATDWSRFGIVHFATHALLDLRHPELSGVVLSLFAADGRAQDGFLRINDLYNLRMPAQLVVLSACESGLGRVDGAEGSFNLARAFFYAGARRVLASLWKVDDRASAEFMAHFYRALLADGRTPAQALRAAQAALAADPLYAAPANWAGYVLQGDWQ